MAAYTRQDIANRIINAYPDAIWTKHPEILEDEDTDHDSQFEIVFKDMAKRLNLFHYMNRSDKLCGLGHYSVMMIGVRDGKDINEPLESVRSADDIMYLTPFSEENAQIQKYDENPYSERYGLPELYSLQVGGYSGSSYTLMASKTLQVHHSRVIHIAEGTLENDVFGIPRLQPILNRLVDLEKVVGGAAEIFWINGRGGLSLNAAKDTEIINPEDIQEHAENYVHQISRILKTKNMDVKTLEFSIHDPDMHVSTILDLISGTTGIPKRILVGSERGELASSQDENNWVSRVIERRDNFCEPIVLRTFIDKMILIGALPSVKEYYINWPDLVVPSNLDRAKIAVDKSSAIATYVNSLGGDTIIPPKQFVEEILGMPYLEEDLVDMFDSENRDMDKDNAIMEKQT
jgi:hypothetical protein